MDNDLVPYLDESGPGMFDGKPWSISPDDSSFTFRFPSRRVAQRFAEELQGKRAAKAVA